MRILLLGLLALLAGVSCSDRQIYDSMQGNRRLECNRYEGNQRSECERRAEMSYTEYEQARKKQ